ncbi:hypothetical protein GF389_00420 [Candidatus Dojkabacteria bacterium]|nr:hypothetical protein [Candidatus Dojkabacteria bacterium]
MDILGLIQKVKAQGADSLASPTFPFDPPGEPATPDTPDIDTETPSIKIEADSIQVTTGENFKIRIILNTQGEQVSSFTTTISFDPEYLAVLDSDQTLSGVQIDHIDTVYEATTNSANNSTGIITLKAEVPEGEETALSRTIAEIELTALKSGTSEVKVIQSSSSLVSTQGTDLLEETNSLNFNISTQSTPGTIDPQNQGTTGTIPKTGFYDNPAYLSVLFGILLVVIGIILARTSASEKNQKT